MDKKNEKKGLKKSKKGLVAAAIGVGVATAGVAAGIAVKKSRDKKKKEDLNEQR